MNPACNPKEWRAAFFYGGLLGCVIVNLWAVLTERLLGDWLFGPGLTSPTRIWFNDWMLIFGIPGGFAIGAWINTMRLKTKKKCRCDQDE